MSRRRDTTGRYAAEAIRRRGYDAPGEPEYRGADPLPLPATPISDQMAEMFANDREAIAWRRSERLAEMFGNGR
jgi:hypothetical protein